MAYTIKVFDTRYDVEHAWTSLDVPNDIALVAVANWEGSYANPPRVFAADGGADALHSNVLQLETPKTYSDTPASGSSAVPITAQWVSKQYNMGLPGRDKRVHLWGVKLRNPQVASTPNNVTVSLYTSGSPTSSTSTAAQTLSVTLSPTTTGDDWGTSPQSGNDITVVRAEGVEQLRSELFQMVVTTADTTMSDFRLAEAELYYTQAG